MVNLAFNETMSFEIRIMSSETSLILTGKVARKDDQMIAQEGISIIYELNGLVPVLCGRCSSI